MSFSIIAAVGENNELGKKGGLCFKLPGDLKYFKQKTAKHKILMGSKTFFSLPKMLPGRTHIVISRKLQPSDLPEGVLLYRSVEEVLADFPTSETEEIFVIGGGMIYQEMLPFCSRLYLTEVLAEDKEADTFFPEFDRSEFLREVVGDGEENGMKYQFVIYRRKESL